MASYGESAPARPGPLSANPFRRVFGDLLSERSGRGRFPPGPSNFDMGRTRRFLRDPLSLLLPLYEEHGPIFSLRLFHMRDVFMLGPEANSFVTVTHPENFHWREGSFADLVPLLGDGLLTIDGGYHDRAREIMMPAFHRERIEAMVETMVEESEAAISTWTPGDVVDVYEWARRLAMRIALRALLGLDPDDGHRGADAAYHFERALELYGVDAHLRLIRGPGTPWRRMRKSRKVLDRIIYGEIDDRRRNRTRGGDTLSLLLEAQAEDGGRLTDQEIRDQLMTLVFAGHDTSSSTIGFLLYELARNPAELTLLRAEQDEVLAGRAPGAAQLGRDLPRLEMVMDETLRLYPPAWIGPRRAVRDFEFAGTRVPAGAYVNYSSWASHRLPEVFPEPDRFLSERFTPERKAALPRGAYIPFGGGSRICIGKRFGQTEVKTVATMITQRFDLELPSGHELTIRQMPTLGPKGGLPMIVRAR